MLPCLIQKEELKTISGTDTKLIKLSYQSSAAAAASFTLLFTELRFYLSSIFNFTFALSALNTRTNVSVVALLVLLSSLEI